MASIRRTLSQMARSCTSVNGEACSTTSPLSKMYSYNSNHQQSRNSLSSCLSSWNCAFYRAQARLFTVFSLRFSRSMEKSKWIRKSWRRSLIHFFVCFFLGAFTGLFSIGSWNSSLTLFSDSQHQTFSFEILTSVDKMEKSVTKSVASAYSSFSNISADQNPNVSNHKFLIIVTPTYDRPLQVYYLNRLARTLKLVPSPLLWLVVEMPSQSIETAELLRNSGVMYRHLVCSKNLTDSKNKGVHLLNVALTHIEIHHLDGITYFADDHNIYALEVFEEMRHVRRFGTWIMGKYIEPKSEIILDGPICNGSQVLGWHKNKVDKKLCRFHVERGGFAFNSTILWHPKRWHRPTLGSVRVLDTGHDDDYISSLIEQIVEDESQMEGFPSNCSKVMVWQHNFAQFEVHHLHSTQNVSLLNRLAT